MIIRQGKYSGKATEFIIFRDPLFVKRLIECDHPQGRLPEVKEDFLKLINYFNKKDFNRSCSWCGSNEIALAFTKGTLFYEIWCPDCSPILLKGIKQERVMLNDYLSAIRYIERYWPGDSSFCRMVVRNIAVLKGLPERYKKEDAMAFFGRNKSKFRCLLPGGSGSECKENVKYCDKCER